MDSFMNIIVIILIVAFIYSFIEIFFMGFFSKFTFKFGIPVLFRKMKLLNIGNNLYNNKTIETTDGLIRFGKDQKIYFRSHGYFFNSKTYAPFPLRAIATLSKYGELNIIARLPISASIIVIAFSIASFAAIITDGISPTLFFILLIWILFFRSYIIEKSRIENMIFELEQVITDNDSLHTSRK
jgi:hypothetical protein